MVLVLACAPACADGEGDGNGDDTGDEVDAGVDGADGGASPPAIGSFPDGFLWGSAIAPYQVEGGLHETDW